MAECFDKHDIRRAIATTLACRPAAELGPGGVASGRDGLRWPRRGGGTHQQSLADHGIGYEHLKELAPTSEIRVAQYAADAAAGEGKRMRTELSDDFKRAYIEQILEPADLKGLLDGFDDSITAALLCVERDPRACHRGPIAECLAADHGVPVEHLMP